jgi:tRNA(Ile)-lysidine synthase
MEAITKKVKDNLSQLISRKNPSILVAFSGGIDSRCLLDILMDLKDDMHLDIAVAYVNHNLRNGESTTEEEFVTGLVDILDLTLYKKSVDKKFWLELKRESVEMAARRIRYDFFNSISKEKKIDYVVTAHNLNDNIETFLLKVLRAGGVDTLSSIPRKNRNIIRPLLNVSRNEIELYVNEKKLRFIEDSSNKKNIYKRNIIRNNIMPILSEIQPGFDVNFEKLFLFFREEKIFINSVIRKIFKKTVVYRSDCYCGLSKEKFQRQGVFVKKHLIKTIIRNIGFPAKPDKYMFASLLSGKKTSYNKNSLLCLERGNIIWFINKEMIFPLKEEISVSSFPFYHESGGLVIELKKDKDAVPGKTFSFDLNKIKFPLVIRSLKKEDIMKTTTEISLIKILKNMKIPSVLFPEVIVIEDKDKTVGFVLDDIFRISSDFYFDEGSETVTLCISKKRIMT